MTPPRHLHLVNDPQQDDDALTRVDSQRLPETTGSTAPTERR